MDIKEGLIPTALGGVVTTAALASKKYVPKNVAWGIAGFGLAHVVLGSIDLIEHRHDDEFSLQSTFDS